MLHHPDRPVRTAEECEDLVRRFLVEPGELLATFAPDGWRHPPLARVFHPTEEQLRAELPTSRHDAAETTSRLIEPEREAVELLGLCLWDVFSDNHTVLDETDTAYHLGSFRASAGFLARLISDRYPDAGHDYIDFYMGTTAVGGRADLRPVYRWIFDSLRAAGCDWRYSFPRVYLIDIGDRGPRDEDFTTYDPSDAVRDQLEEDERKEGLRSLAERLDAAYRAAVERARHEPLPSTVAAYREVYGRLPDGWPHPQM